jgi:hypothetical protein
VGWFRDDIARPIEVTIREVPRFFTAVGITEEIWDNLDQENKHQ